MRLLAVAAVGATALVVVAAVGGAPNWAAPVQLSSGTRALRPELALAPSGEALVVWDQELGAECPTQPAALSCTHVVTAATRARGSSAWSPPIELSRPGVGSLPRGALDGNGGAAVAWIHDIGRDRVLQATYRRGASGTWPEPNDVSEASLGVRSHRIAMDEAGNVLVVWAERTRDVFDVMAAFRDASSGAWFAPQRLSSLEWGAASGPDLTVTPTGAAAVSWVDGRDTVWVALGSTSTRTWGAPIAVSPSGPPARRSPTIAGNAAGDLAVAWEEHTAGAGDGAVAVTLRPRSGTWTESMRVGPVGSGPGDEANVALDERGDVVVAWVAPSGVLRAASGPPAQGWRVQDVSRPGVRAVRPQLSVTSGGNAVCIWAEGDDAPLWSSLKAAQGTIWQQARVSPSAWLQARVAVDGVGRATAVWERRSPGSVVVESAELGSNGPFLEQVTVPRRAFVGAKVEFAARPVAWIAPLAAMPLWRFGDGRQARGARVSHRYARPGEYRVSVSSADVAGGSTTATRTIRVARRRP
jgi:hypothetical protein